MAARYVSCFECKQKVDKEEAIDEKPHYYHRECYAKKIQRRELFDYICRLMNLKSPGPIIYKQRKEYIEKNGYTDVGILNTLKYIYEIKRLSVKKAEERIGLVPYYYNEAQQYFARKDREQKEIMNSMSAAIQNSSNETLVIDTKVNAKQNIKLINPMDWWQEDEN